MIEFLSASFELMRKEQHKILQEKQKSKPEKHKTEDIVVLLEDNKEDRTVLDKNSEADGMTTQPSANSDLGKTSFPSQNPPARPRVPPGFKTTVLDKKSGSNLSHSRVTEVFTCYLIFSNRVLCLSPFLIKKKRKRKWGFKEISKRGNNKRGFFISS